MTKLNRLILGQRDIIRKHEERIAEYQAEIDELEQYGGYFLRASEAWEVRAGDSGPEAPVDHDG